MLIKYKGQYSTNASAMQKKMFKILALLAFHIFLIELSVSEKIIIDTDAGVDDAMALLLLLRGEEGRDPKVSPFEIIAITCTYGNTHLENVELNVLKTLTVANRTDIPVYAGSKRALKEPTEFDYYFGNDGFGDVKFEYEITAKIDRSKHAVNALIDLAKENDGNISIITLGPMTNIAMSITMDNNFPKYVNKFYTMGGSVNGIGNKRPNVEFNFAGDPDSNFIFFNSSVTEAQIVLTPLELSSENLHIPKSWREKVLGRQKSLYIRFLNKIEAVSLSKSKSQFWSAADVTTAASFLRPDIISSSVTRNVQAVSCGEGRGSILVDYRNMTEKLTNTKIIQSFNLKAYKNVLFSYLGED